MEAVNTRQAAAGTEFGVKKRGVVSKNEESPQR